MNSPNSGSDSNNFDPGNTIKNKDRIFASPLAKRMARDAGIELAQINGTGPHGRIVKSDVEAIKKNTATKGFIDPTKIMTSEITSLPAMSPTGGSYSEIPNSSIRKIIADRLTSSARDIPTYTVTIDCVIDRLLDMRSDLNGRSPKEDGKYKISINDFVIRAVALAIRKMPEINTSWTDAAIIQYDNIDVSVAVTTPDGLITPIIRHADQKGLAEISIEMKQLALRARDNKLLPEEFQGGSFTISNMGMYGVKEFTSIINPPQSCILSVGVGEQRAIVRDGALGIATIMSCTMASDHRTVDGSLSAQFLQVFKAMIEDPLTMLL